MNKQAILQADDHVLDEWCAKYIHKWQQAEHNYPLTKDPVSFYRLSWASVDYSEPEFGGGQYSHAWYMYNPTEDAQQAIELLDLVATEWRIEGNTKGQWSVSLKSTRGDPAIERIKWYHGEANSMAKAIVLACLSAVVEDSQP